MQDIYRSRSSLQRSLHRHEVIEPQLEQHFTNQDILAIAYSL